jgi:hypothetical protein
LKTWFEQLPTASREVMLNTNPTASLFFTQTVLQTDFKALADTNSRESIYPDETDLRHAADEIDNPIGCY